MNQRGRSQAQAASEFLKNISIQKAFSSSLSRPRETAQIILKEHPGIKISLKDNLKEISHGKWEGKLESEINSDWPDLLKTWKILPEKVQMPDGENIKEVSKRSIAGWIGICKNLKDNETALVVAHDAVNKTILCHLLGLMPSEIWMIKQGNGGITVIDLSEKEDQPDQIICLNITSHLGGILDSTAAVALGASVIEKHFTLSRSDKGPDSAFSIEPPHELRGGSIEMHSSIDVFHGLNAIIPINVHGKKINIVFNGTQIFL